MSKPAASGGIGKHYVLAILTLTYTWSLLDQSLIALLLQPIKADLRLSDTQLGLLTGIAYGLVYAAMGVPFALWADRGRRNAIASLAMATWGIAMMLCLNVRTFMQLGALRIVAAVGGAGCMPPTYSLLGDYFPAPTERTRAMTIYMLANSVSFLASFWSGGWLNEVYGWRVAFFVVGCPALVIAGLMIATVAEPRRNAVTARSAEALPAITHVLGALWRQRSARHLAFAIILAATMGLALAPWYAAFMMRSHGMSAAEVGRWLGLSFGFSSLTGTLLGGYVAGRWFAHDERGQLRLLAVLMALLVPCFVLFLLLPDRFQVLLVSVPLMAIFCCYFGPAFALMQRLVPEEARATTIASVMLVGNLVGMAAGPLVVGSLSDALQPRLSTDSLRYAMLIVSFLALGIAHQFWRSGQTIAEDLARLAQDVASAGGGLVDHSLPQRRTMGVV